MKRLNWLSAAVAAIGAAAACVSVTAAPSPADLLARMTLDEKIGQMVQVDLKALAAPEDLARLSIGSVLSGGGSDPADNLPATWAATVDALQAAAMRSRLGIPILYGIDAVHGHNNVDGAVVFPHNIGLGASRDPELVRKAAAVTAAEIAGTGMHWTFAPCVAVPRDERWGRTYEGFGETPDLAVLLGPAAVRGFQGLSPAARESVAACVKHFVGDGGTKGGIDQGDTVIDEAELRRIHLPGYAAAVKAGALTIMVSYNSWNGAKMHGEKRLLTDVLKGELGFGGFLVSDWAAIDQLPGDYRSDIEASINAGLDMIMIPNGPGKPNNYVEFISLLKYLVEEGKVPPARIDDAVLRILRVKAALGLWDRTKTDPALLSKVGSPAHRQVARECVRASLVLLKNGTGVLPLKKDSKHVHVAGRAADDLGMQCGGWTIEWQGATGAVTRGGTTLLAAIRAAVSPDTKITYSIDGSGASGADAAVVVLGEMPYAEMKGDRKDLAVAAEDVAVLRAVKAAGVPAAVVLYSGRPLILGPVADEADALVAAWLPGTEGAGVADVLFGDFKPAGKLPHTWPRAMAQVPVNDGDAGADPLFPFGFGLSYGGR